LYIRQCMYISSVLFMLYNNVSTLFSFSVMFLFFSTFVSVNIYFTYAMWSILSFSYFGGEKLIGPMHKDILLDKHRAEPTIPLHRFLFGHYSKQEYPLSKIMIVINVSNTNLIIPTFSKILILLMHRAYTYSTMKPTFD